MTADAAVREVQRSHGAANVTMRNIVTSLRVIAEVDWTELFKQICLVDSVLTLGGAFVEMDFATRTLYRTAVERLARGSRQGELESRALPSPKRASRIYPFLPWSNCDAATPVTICLRGDGANLRSRSGFASACFGPRTRRPG